MSLPLQGIRVLEFTHAVMGPTAGLVLADLGAEVIHIEPPEGDATRRLRGFGTGYWPFYSRNKKSLAVDLKTDAGRSIVMRLAESADVVVENFGPGTMERLGYGPSDFHAVAPRLVYCSLKGFLPGPYEHRIAMDEVVQMMGGLAYMTGPPGRPLRAGTSIVDIGGGMFGVIGILSALYERERTGRGTVVRGALFETTAFFMGQHMAYAALSEGPVPPMPARVSAWSIYRTFESADGEPVFVGVISDKHFQRFCEAFERPEWATDPRLATNNQRIAEASWFLPAIEAQLRRYTKQEILARCEAATIPVAPIARPEDLFDDPHLNQPDRGLLATPLESGASAKLPRLPLDIDGCDFALRNGPPAIGADTRALLAELGYADGDIDGLAAAGTIAVSD